jgi:hypothetical protein
VKLSEKLYQFVFHNLRIFLMPSFRVAKNGMFIALLVFVVACAPNQPTPLPQASAPVNAVVVLPVIIDSLQQWSGREFTLITPVKVSDQDRVLVVNPETSGEAGTQMMNGIWLAEPLSSEIEGGLNGGKGIVKLKGRLSPPGAYGKNQQYPYQFTVEQGSLLAAERSTIANLALNPSALDGVLLRLEGTMLVRSDAALLVDKVSEGGVPQADAHQIKLQHVSLDEAAQRSFTRNGDVQWGAVDVVGWWQDGALTVFALSAK